MRIHVARSFLQRARGLLGRAPLAADEALLIRPCSSIHTFGMRFALDLVFLDARGRVVKRARGVPPGRIRWGGRRARATLEAQAGWLPDLPDGALAELGCASR